LIVGVIALGLSIWTVKPFVDKWRAERLVDELCRVDGGVKVYEVVEVPPAASGKGKPMDVPFKRFRKKGDEFYSVMTVKDIRGHSGSSDVSALTVYRTEIGIYRAKDDKLLGTAVGYARRGGDPFWQFHPSSYRCPENQNVTNSVLVEKKR